MPEYRWIDLGNGRRVYRRVREETSSAAPHVIGDTIEPTQSMADGRIYTSKSKLRASYKPSGNPQGERYIEVGNDPARFRERPKPKPDAKGIHEAVQKAVARLNR